MPRDNAAKSLSVKPRVQIAYEVDVNGALELKEIPFVMGVMADLSGDNSASLPELKERKFTDVTAHKFDEFLKAQEPRATFEVDNTLTGEGKLKVNLTFESMDDFSPAAVARKVDVLKQLFDSREELNSLLTRVGSKPKLEKVLEILVKNPDLAKKYQAEIGPGPGPNS
jgi:type VI secretion system protein ImpB